VEPPEDSRPPQGRGTRSELDLYIRTALRLERGRRGVRDDEERVLFDGERAPEQGWIATREPRSDAFVVEHGHIHADEEHVLLQEQFRVEAGRIVLSNTLRMEGHPLRSFAPAFRRSRFGHPIHVATDLAVKQTHEVVDILADPVLRGKFARAIVHPDQLTRRMQRSLLFLVLLSSVWLWTLGTVILVIGFPAWTFPWNLAWSLFFASLGTNLFLPIPIEPVALAATGALGIPLAIISSAAGKAVGAWIIFMLGGPLRRGVSRLEGRSRVARAVMWRADRFARRFGYAALGLMLAVPFSPFDIIPVYLFSTLQLRLGPFLTAVFLGFALRLFTVLVLGGSLLGVLGIH
jgi:membrane protein DedA with SNARE-associated domain